MSRSFLVALVATLCSCLAGTAEAAAANGLRLDPLGGVKFPDRAFVLTVPKKADLTVDDISMRENGAPVGDLRVVPGRALDQRDFGAVLVIDASLSMGGDAIRGAMRSARSFAAQRDPQQPLGVVTFNKRSDVRLAPTTDGEKIKAALAGEPRLGRETHIYDATSLAMRRLRDAGVSAGTVIVLSDGSDTGSRTTLKAVAAEARRSSVRIFTVGLRTRAYSATTLRSLARATRGTFQEAGSTARLEGIYRTLGTTLANQYVVRYRSTSRVGQEVRVALRARGQGGVASTSYRVPALDLGGANDAGDGFLGTSTSALLISLLAALMLGGCVLIATAPGRSVRTRVGRYVAAPADDEHLWGRTLVASVFGEQGPGRGTSRSRLAQISEELELAAIRVTPEALFFWVVAGSVLVGAFFAVAAGSGGAAFLGLLVPVAIVLVVRVRVARQRRRFADQLPENLQVVASAMRAGHTFGSALAAVVHETPEPSRRELTRVLKDEQIGVPLHEALVTASRRMRSPDLERLALVTSLQETTGGNTAEVIDSLNEAIRERLDVLRLVRSLTAQGRITQVVVTSMPPAILLILATIAPEYVRPLWAETAGIVALVVAAIGVVIGSVLISRIIDIEV